jgi:hypothetical protein
MPVVKITGQGLSAIALLVALLWYCLLTERAIARQANAGRVQALQEIRRLRHRTAPQPVSAPMPQQASPARLALG